MSFLVVTPARDERDRLPRLARSLAAQAPGLVARWVVVDDGSHDGTAELAEELALPFPVDVVRRPRQDGAGLATASEFTAFLAGADAGLASTPDVKRVMKCDADIVLDHGYLAALHGLPRDVGIAGGVITGIREREQADFVRGPIKAYSREAFSIVRQLPAALGWDVLDAAAVGRAGLRVEVCREARASVNRRTGSSEGLLAGRVRGGVVSRWTGYHPVYFAARLLRYALRRPIGIGAVAMACGYLSAGRGPWPAELRETLRSRQRSKLRRLARNPAGFLAAAYGVRP